VTNTFNRQPHCGNVQARESNCLAWRRDWCFLSAWFELESGVGLFVSPRLEPIGSCGGNWRRDSLRHKSPEPKSTGSGHRVHQRPGRPSTFRIPATAVTSRGTVLAFAEGRKNSASDTGDIDLGLKRSTDGGRRCGAPDIVCDDSLNTCGHPCPVVERRRVRFPYALPNARRANELKGCV
jgi:hypothetical protein